MVSQKDMQIRNEFVKKWIAEPWKIPFSFTVDGDEMRGVPENYRFSWEHMKVDRAVSVHILKAENPQRNIEIRVEYVEYDDFPVCEWTVWIKNTGKENSKIFEQMRAMKYSFHEKQGILWKCNGDFNSAKGYTPMKVRLTEKMIYETPYGGRCCDRAFPYHRIQFPDYGIVIATGWPAQWDGKFWAENIHDDLKDTESDGKGKIWVDIGQQNVHFYLKPRECVRMPRMAVPFHEGSEDRAINLWRRWGVTHLTPCEWENPIRPKLIRMNSGGGEEFTCATEKNQIEGIENLHRLPLYKDSVWWIDAGWYPCEDYTGEKHWVRVGTWEADTSRFPRGLGPVGERLEKEGIPFLMWFEPERVMYGQKMEREHPQWILRLKSQRQLSENELDGQTFMLNLANEECVDWLIEHIDHLIKEFRIKIYRQDFNIEPLWYWQDNEEKDRRGILENYHVQGYLRYWDALRLRNPGLIIDACASGGRRYDLETMRRAVPMHPTDYGYGVHSVKLAFAQTMAEWFPYFRLMVLSWEREDGSYNSDGCFSDGRNQYEHSGKQDAFDVHCALAPMISPGDATGEQLERIWKKGAELMIEGDYYPLTPFSAENDHYVARQFWKPEQKEGFVQIIRLEFCTTDTYHLVLRGLEKECRYIFRDVETDESFITCGKSMTEEGIDVTIRPRSGKMLWFHAV